jgi:CRP/FNR family transcriptional regulator, cyclic AMP receptor protein
MSAKKSGLITFKPGDVLFNQGDLADCLYIIQKGQLRLYLPKGRGFVDLAILRSGEVIGEMSFFDEKSMKRSCSAAAIVTTEVVKISFGALNKAIEGLNPWLKTLIYTMAERLRRTNSKVKELEGNSVGFGAAGKVGDYKFFQTVDVLRILGTIFLVAKAHGETADDGRWKIHINKLKYYLYDIYSLKEIKYEELMQILVSENYIEMANDEDGKLNVVVFENLDELRMIVAFVNQERLKDDSKKTKVSSRCETVLAAAMVQAESKGEIPDKVSIDLSAILENFAANKVEGNDEDLRDAIAVGLCDDIIVGSSNKLTFNLFYNKTKKIFPALRFQNAIERHNEKKARAGGGY